MDLAIAVQNDGKFLLFCFLSLNVSFLSDPNIRANPMVGGTQLTVNQVILSTNKCFKLQMQPDSNLVVYQTKDLKPLWASGTMNSGAVVAKMQTDGNFILYDAGSNIKWASATSSNPGAILNLLDTGNLVVQTSASNSAPLWQTGVTGSC